MSMFFYRLKIVMPCVVVLFMKVFQIQKKQKARKALENFHFITPSPVFQVHCNQSNNLLQLQVDVFCHEIADAVDAWAKSVQDNKDIQERMVAPIIIHDSSNGIPVLNTQC